MPIRKLLFRLVRRVTRHISESVEIDGMWIASWEKDDGSIAKVRAALDVIRTHDPRRYRRLSADLRGIWAILLPGALAQFSPEDFLCEIDLRYLKSATAEDVASTIVHEAVHARLWRRGHRYEETVRARVEAICFRQQKAFAARLPSAGPMAELLDRYLDLAAPHYSDSALASRHHRGSVAVMRELKAPHWLIGMVLRRQRRRQRKRRTAARLGAGRR